jgi:hypothetical protein
MSAAPGLWFCAAVAVLAAFSLWHASSPGLDDRLLFAALAWLIAAPAWIAGILFARGASGRGRFVGWVSAAVIAVPTLGAIALGLPPRVRFALSRAAFERAAADVMRSAEPLAATTGRGSERVGLYSVDHREAFPGGARFGVEGSGLFTRGFAYAPAGSRPPSSSGEDEYVALDGDWYVWISMP